MDSIEGRLNQQASKDIYDLPLLFGQNYVNSIYVGIGKLNNTDAVGGYSEFPWLDSSSRKSRIQNDKYVNIPIAT